MLVDETVEVVRTETLGQVVGDVTDAPAEAEAVETGAHVLTVVHERAAAEGLQRPAAIHSTGTDADGGVEAVAADLDQAVEELLDIGRATPYPAHVVLHREELRRLQDGQTLVLQQERQQLVEVVLHRAEVCIEVGDEFAGGAGEGIAEIAGLLVLAGIVAAQVDYAPFRLELLHQGETHGRQGIVEHIDRRFIAVSALHLHDVAECVLADLQRFSAYGVVDIHCGPAGKRLESKRYVALAHQPDEIGHQQIADGQTADD